MANILRSTIVPGISTVRIKTVNFLSLILYPMLDNARRTVLEFINHVLLLWAEMWNAITEFARVKILPSTDAIWRNGNNFLKQTVQYLTELWELCKRIVQFSSFVLLPAVLNYSKQISVFIIEYAVDMMSRLWLSTKFFVEHVIMGRVWLNIKLLASVAFTLFLKFNEKANIALNILFDKVNLIMRWLLDIFDGALSSITSLAGRTILPIVRYLWVRTNLFVTVFLLPRLWKIWISIRIVLSVTILPRLKEIMSYIISAAVCHVISVVDVCMYWLIITVQKIQTILISCTYVVLEQIYQVWKVAKRFTTTVLTPKIIVVWARLNICIIFMWRRIKTGSHTIWVHVKRVVASTWSYLGSRILSVWKSLVKLLILTVFPKITFLWKNMAQFISFSILNLNKACDYVKETIVTNLIPKIIKIWKYIYTLIFTVIYPWILKLLNILLSFIYKMFLPKVVSIWIRSITFLKEVVFQRCYKLALGIRKIIQQVICPKMVKCLNIATTFINRYISEMIGAWKRIIFFTVSVLLPWIVKQLRKLLNVIQRILIPKLSGIILTLKNIILERFRLLLRFILSWFIPNVYTLVTKINNFMMSIPVFLSKITLNDIKEGLMNCISNILVFILMIFAVPGYFLYKSFKKMVYLLKNAKTRIM